MKKLILLLGIFILACNTNEKVNSLYNKYERELIAGNVLNAEGFLDKIIIIDNKPKYLELKITFLLN